MTDDASDLLTVAEVAKRFRTSKMTVYRLVKTGDLEALRIGRSYRVPERAVDAYLAAASTVTVPAPEA